MPPVGIGFDYKAEHQQSLSQVIRPTTQTLTFTSTEPLKRKSLSSQVGEGENRTRCSKQGCIDSE